MPVTLMIIVLLKQNNLHYNTLSWVIVPAVYVHTSGKFTKLQLYVKNLIKTIQFEIGMITIAHVTFF